MIYFKITDTESEAWKRHETYNELRAKAFDQVKELVEELGIESKQFKADNVHGEVSCFLHEKGQHRPTGMRVRDGKLLPNRRTKAGKAITRKMEAIKFPTNSKYMEVIFGASGEWFTGNRWYFGCGMTCNENIVLIRVRPKVFEDAAKKDSFDRPEGLTEIMGSEYLRHKEEMNGEKLKTT